MSPGPSPPRSTAAGRGAGPQGLEDAAVDQNPVTDTTSADPTTNSLDYHPDQRQEIPSTDSSNTIGTDTINSSQATPNTGTEKSYNDAKENKDSTHH